MQKGKSLMDFKISSGSGKHGLCPKCGKKILNMVHQGVRQRVCSCGWKQILNVYPNSAINSDQISLG